MREYSLLEIWADQLAIERGLVEPTKQEYDEARNSLVRNNERRIASGLKPIEYEVSFL